MKTGFSGVVMGAAMLALAVAAAGCASLEARREAWRQQEEAQAEDARRRAEMWKQSDLEMRRNRELQERYERAMERDEKLQAREEALQSRLEKQADRMDALLDKWEGRAEAGKGEGPR
ncbi:MAG: hypothetical protein FJ225_07055 [Lentisphaerae bacterium]|nr:hypothetical protein [Lentisphaerota bacterium]